MPKGRLGQMVFIIPAYNEEKHLGPCITSIKNEAHREQHRVRCRIMVVDNRSTDRTPMVALAHSVDLVFCPEMGITQARQSGYLAMAEHYKNTDYVAFIDADNMLPEGWLRVVLNSFDHDTVMVTGPHYYTNWSPFWQAVTGLFYILGRISHHIIGPMSMGGNNVILKKILDKIGGYPTQCEFYGEDSDFARVVGKVGKIKIVPEMWVWSDPRRMDYEGVIVTTWKYVINYLSICFRGKPISHKHRDIRT